MYTIDSFIRKTRNHRTFIGNKIKKNAAKTKYKNNICIDSSYSSILFIY